MRLAKTSHYPVWSAGSISLIVEDREVEEVSDFSFQGPTPSDLPSLVWILGVTKIPQK